MYGRRNKFDPLWNQYILAGFRDGKRYPFSLCRASSVVSCVSHALSALPVDWLMVIDLPSWRHSFLGQVDLYGTAFQDTTLATGYGAHIARPLMRKAYRPDLSEEEARKVLEDCMRVMFYRDARTINRIQLAKVRSPVPSPAQHSTEQPQHTPR